MFEPERATATLTNTAVHRVRRPLERRLALQCALGLPLLASLSVGALLALSPTAHALELGDARVVSYLGQPLVVEIPYRTHAAERLTSACVSLVPADRGQLPAYTQITGISTRNSTITIRGSQRIRDPLVGLNLRIACSSAPHIVRSYELFVNPALVAQPRALSSSPAETTAAATVPKPAVVRRPVAQTPSARSRGNTGQPIVPGQTYSVVRGDSLSGIAARITPRNVTLWTAVDRLFAANPQAFDNGDPNQLREGASLTIPWFGNRAAPVSTPAAAEPATVPISPNTNDAGLAALAASLAAPTSAAPEPTVATPEPATATLAATAPVDANAGAPTTTAPNDKPTQSASPFVDPAAAAAPAPEVLSHDAAAGGARSTRDGASPTTAWLLGGIAIGAALVLLVLWLFAKRRPTREPSHLDAFDTAAPALATPTATTVPPASAPKAPSPLVASSPLDLDDFDVSHQYGTSSTYVEADVAYAPTDVATAELSALDHTTPPEDDPLAISSVDLDIGEALAATGIDIGEATAAVENGDTSTVTHLTAGTDPDDSSITIAEMDMLAEDYEAEFTATQQLNKDLAAAVADLKRTQSGHGSAVVPLTRR